MDETDYGADDRPTQGRRPTTNGPGQAPPLTPGLGENRPPLQKTAVAAHSLFERVVLGLAEPVEEPGFDPVVRLVHDPPPAAGNLAVDDDRVHERVRIP